MLFEEHLPADVIDAAGDRFRELYPVHAIEPVCLSRRGPRTRWPPYAVHNGRIVVVTGKFPRNAQLHVDHLAMDIDLLEGWVWGLGKAEVLRREGAQIYVGDHIHDVEGALAAEALSVSVATGGCTARRAAARRQPCRTR